MEIRLEDFSGAQIEKEEIFGPSVVDQWLIDYEGYKNSGEIFSSARFTKRNTQILMQAHLKGSIKGLCARCLEEAIIPIDTDITIIFLPISQQKKYVEDEEVELTSEELDIEYYKGNKIDVDYLFRESLLLAIPISPLCNESCKGLCPECGGNLNRGECICQNKKAAFNGLKINLL